MYNSMRINKIRSYFPVQSCLLDSFTLFLLGCLWETSRGLRLVRLFYLFYLFLFFCFFFRVGKSLACHSPGKWCLCA